MLGVFNLRQLFGRRLPLLGLALILIAAIIACGEEATPTAEPAATPEAVAPAPCRN